MKPPRPRPADPDRSVGTIPAEAPDEPGPPPGAAFTGADGGTITVVCVGLVRPGSGS
jgi:hypothetical protein